MTYREAAELLKKELAHGPFVCLTAQEQVKRRDMLKIAIELVEREARMFEDAIDTEFVEVEEEANA